MKNKYQLFLKTNVYTFLAAFVFMMMPYQAHATCGVTDVIQMGVGTVKKVQEFKTQLESLSQLNSGVVDQQDKTSKSLNNVGKNVADGAAMVSKSFLTALDGMGYQEEKFAKEMAEAKIARDSAISYHDCAIASGAGHALEGRLLEKASSQLTAKAYADEVLRTGNNAFNISNATNSLAFKTDFAIKYIATYCDPESNGGVMPTQENPIITDNGPVWCGMARGADDGHLVNLPQKLIPAILDPTKKLEDDPRVREGIVMTMMQLFGMPIDKIDLASLGSAEGKQKFMNTMRAVDRRMLPVTYFANLVGPNYANLSPAASEWVRDIVITEDLPDEIKTIYEENYKGNVSQSQFFDAQVKLLTRPDYLVLNTANSEGQYDRQKLALQSMLVDIQTQRLKEARAGNLLNAAIAATQGGGTGLSGYAFNQ